MIEYSFKSNSSDNTIHCYEWPVEKPVALLQLVHGMAEHMERYDAFARYLNQFGIAVAGHDHVGHGKTSEPENYGYFGESDGWINFAKDTEQFRSLLDEKYDVKHFILGHSMGSFVTRVYLSLYGENVDGAVIMGTSGENKAAGFGLKLIKLLRKVQGSRHISALITQTCFGTYCERIENPVTTYEWLSRDNDVVNAYAEDPACGFTFTLAGYSDLFHLISFMSRKECFEETPDELPILLVAGEEDPVGSYGEGVKEVFEKYQSFGLSNVSMKLYEGMRHEILNEFGKEEVYEDIKNFVMNNI